MHCAARPFSQAMTPLEAEIRAMIETSGPISVAQYMELCLGHPEHGYYITRDPFGARGDFITAPEVSQMFGELIGVWAASVWQLFPPAEAVHLVELGPGRGTLMADVLRAASVVPAFRAAIRVHLVETSPILRRRQEASLSGCGVPVHWHDHVMELPRVPSIIIANEFFDALPVHQAVKVPGGWHERMVGLDGDRLVFTLRPELMWRVDEALPAGIRAAPVGAVFEWRRDWIMRCIADRTSYGVVLVIDYGHVESGIGETLQAVARHGFAGPLDAPGEADLTAHVDFQALGEAAASKGARVHGPLTQGEFLRRLGIEERAHRLKAGATPKQAQEIDAALARLTEPGRTGMGELFKVMALAHPELGDLPGFDS
jgi:NADH dehydrogenase [ubiquinone] 1 alpha subcomplex assembly factor 7